MTLVRVAAAPAWLQRCATPARVIGSVMRGPGKSQDLS